MAYLRCLGFARDDPSDTMPSEITNEPVSPLSQDDKASLVSTDAVDTKSGVDVAVGLITGHFDDDSLSLQESQRLRAKLDWHLLPLLFAIYARMCLTLFSVELSNTDRPPSAIHRQVHAFSTILSTETYTVWDTIEEH